ncbi:MAG: hypothetical protein E3J72_08020 [Planctomycetota bacterium]|nr:MAG: hypothetical protein E3J72_08020 [Planctomycetota bacterium]
MNKQSIRKSKYILPIAPNLLGLAMSLTLGICYTPAIKGQGQDWIEQAVFVIITAIAAFGNLFFVYIIIHVISISQDKTRKKHFSVMLHRIVGGLFFIASAIVITGFILCL